MEKANNNIITNTSKQVQDGHQGIRANHSNFLKQDNDT